MLAGPLLTPLLQRVVCVALGQAAWFRLRFRVAVHYCIPVGLPHALIDGGVLVVFRQKPFFFETDFFSRDNAANDKHESTSRVPLG